ncbi:MAG: single-stranded DNA-binding protein [Candidatus Aminicenantes bacterium]|nr:single-stranded DNA-binding protein [Candidatus Aminicenantes bacterium]
MAGNVKSLNRVVLVGNVQPREPEVSHIPSLGRDVAKFTIVTKEGYMDKSNQWQESSEWHNIVAWGYNAKKVEKSIKRGSLVLIEGKIKSRKWQDKNGQDRRTTEIIADTIVPLDRGQQGSSDGSSSYDSGNSYNGGSSNLDNENNPEVTPEAQIDDIPYDDPF